MGIAPGKTKTAYYCTRCGAEHSKWQGQCRECSEWNCLVEERVPQKTAKGKPAPSTAVALSAVTTDKAEGFASGITEFDRVLGGQAVPGVSVLIGGEPGIGKSTLLLQVAGGFASNGMSVLYVTGEESLAQIRIRADRIGIDKKGVTALNSTSIEEIADHIASGKYQAVFVDSIQTMASGQFDSPPGTVSQVRECANQLIQQARANHVALFLVGHVTKDGMVAGPKVLEHMVDTVIYFEGDSAHVYRLLRAVKNRYGSVSEIGVFEMGPKGLVEVANPSSLFLSGFSSSPRTGSVVAPICEGSRPILVEVQALVAPATYGSPQRVANGFDAKRLALLLAILEKRCGYVMSQSDVFVSIAGGLRVTEPAIDLAVLIALVSSAVNRPIDARTVVTGEVGLSGEVRGIPMIDRRVAEAAKLGFKSIVLPKANEAQLTDVSLDVMAVKDLQSAVDRLVG
ncbi:MAG: DNA repair protein RadA [Candidatus Zixiibacteriota bacterium]